MQKTTMWTSLIITLFAVLMFAQQRYLTSRGGEVSSEQGVLGPVVQMVDPLPPLTKFCSASATNADAIASAATATMASFNGLSESDGPFRNSGQADTSGSAGLHAFGEVVNAAIGFFDKNNGTLLCPAQPTATMWSGTPCAITAISDAVLKYDSNAHRWLVSRPGGPIGDAPGSQCIAISEGEDPTGAWFRYQFPLSIPGIAAFGDYPKISIWSNSYTFSARGRTTVLPTQVGTAILGDYAIAFDRHAMLAGDSAGVVEFFVTQNPSPVDLFHFLPASTEGDSASPGDAPAPFLERFEGQSSQLAMWELDVDWAHPEQAQFVRTGIMEVEAYTSVVPPITQPAIDGVPAPKLLAGLRAGSVALMQPLIYRRVGDDESIFGNLTTAISMIDGTHAGIRWFELRKSPLGWYVFQQGTYAPADGNDRWLASLNVDREGNLGMVFNVSGPSVFPSLHYTSRSAFDPLGTLRPEQSLIEGGGSQFGNAPGCLPDPDGGVACGFGDYAQGSIDPVNDCVFWMAGEYYPDQAQATIPNFSTRIGSIQFPSCRPAENE